MLEQKYKFHILLNSDLERKSSNRSGNRDFSIPTSPPLNQLRKDEAEKRSSPLRPRWEFVVSGDKNTSKETSWRRLFTSVS